MSFRIRFEAAHRLSLAQESKCATPHGHTWHATLHLQASEHALGPEAMVRDFDLLKGPWKSFIQDVVDHSFMHHHQDPIFESLRTHIPNLRSLPFPSDPTTEAVACLFYEKALALYGDRFPEVTLTGVTIEETPVNSVGYSPGPMIPRQWTGWWRDPALDSREIRPA